MNTLSNTPKDERMFFDDEDGRVDMSNFLLSKAGFLPVPILITNPALGYGGMLAATFFHESLGESGGYPTVSGIIGGGTQNKTWMGGVFHMQSFFDKRVRYSGFAGYGDINMRFYGLGYTDYFKNNEHSLYSNAYITNHKAVAKLADSKFYLGTNYLLMSSDVSLRPVPTFLENLLSQEYLISQLSLVLSYDSRDNFFSPTKGIMGEISWNYSDQWLGATSDYNSFYSYIVGYTKVPYVDALVAGLRLEYDVAFEGIPFFMQPFASNRGVALMRYQDKQLIQLESEFSYALDTRWDLIGFVGVADAYGTGSSTFFSDDIAISGGGGFRYLLARKFGIKAGVDVSYSEEPSFRIVMGSAWLRN